MTVSNDIDTAYGVMIYVEKGEQITLELFTEGRRLAEQLSQPLSALFVGKNPPLKDAQLYGVDSLHHIPATDEEERDYSETSKSVARVLQRLSPSIFLMGATKKGRVLAPLVAARLLAGITADCTEFSLDEKNNLIQIRPALGGNIMAHIVSTETRPQCATVRPGTFKAVFAGKPTKTEIIIEKEHITMSETVTKIDEIEKSTSENDTQIELSRVVVAIGAGIKSEAEIGEIRKFATEIGAEIASSRELVEKGLMPHGRQVGQSGKTIAPDLYIAIGISGAIQHLVGMRDSEFIIAINSDKDAPIHKESDISIVGVWQEVLSELLPIIKERLSK
ncbi:electron transfer flavoprotein subunit alpha/FixB family protein [bacterium]|nr:electron transfer flavoprotein subunit alpha/FixB family protein [bacterium]